MHRRVVFADGGSSLVVLPISLLEVRHNFFIRNYESLWLTNQTLKKSVAGKSKFQCVLGQVKMAPPLGPVLAQFLSSLAADFISFLNGLKDTFQLPSVKPFDEQTFDLNPISVVLFKLKSEEFRLRLSFNAAQMLFCSSNFTVVSALWKNSFGLLVNLFNTSSARSVTVENIEGFRVILKNLLQLEAYLFLVFNLYLSLCAWFATGLFSAKLSLDCLMFAVKNFSFEESPNFFAFAQQPVLNFFIENKCLSSLFLTLYKAVSFIYRGFRCTNTKIVLTK